MTIRDKLLQYELLERCVPVTVREGAEENKQEFVDRFWIHCSDAIIRVEVGNLWLYPILFFFSPLSSISLLIVRWEAKNSQVPLTDKAF